MHGSENREESYPKLIVISPDLKFFLLVTVSSSVLWEAISSKAEIRALFRCYFERMYKLHILIQILLLYSPGSMESA